MKNYKYTKNWFNTQQGIDKIYNLDIKKIK